MVLRAVEPGPGSGSARVLVAFAQPSIGVAKPYYSAQDLLSKSTAQFLLSGLRDPEKRTEDSPPVSERSAHAVDFKR
jgi:hypothetical protein